MTTQLKRIREASGRKPQELADAAGISVAEYYDFEAHDDELDCVASVGAVARVAMSLKISPSVLYGAASHGYVTPVQLAERVREHIEQNAKTLPELEEQVGWSLDGALANPDEFREFTADGLRALCDAIGVEWADVLDAL